MVEIGQTFCETESLKVAVTRKLLHDSKSVRCGNGDSKQKRFSCSTCTAWVVNATKQQRERGVWKISNTKKAHVNCVGNGATAPITTIAPTLDSYARANPKMTVPAMNGWSRTTAGNTYLGIYTRMHRMWVGDQVDKESSIRSELPPAICGGKGEKGMPVRLLLGLQGLFVVISGIISASLG